MFFMTQRHMSEIRRAVAIANRQAKSKGKKVLDPQIVRFSCRCNCFYVNVETESGEPCYLHPDKKKGDHSPEWHRARGQTP